MKFPNLESDICIIGSGPAGITAALEIAKSKKSILLIEAGDFSPKDITPFEAEEHGIPTHLQAHRLRMFGGTSGHWAGWCSPLDASNFQANSFENMWPISYEEMIPYYDEASEYLNLHSFRADQASHQRINDKIGGKRFYFSSPVTRFGVQFKNAILKSKHIRFLKQATLVDFSVDQDSRVQSAIVDIEGTRNQIKAKQYILACGGIENARLLLNFKKQNPNVFQEDGFYIGKGFMDHPHFYNVGRLISTGFNRILNKSLTDEYGQTHKHQNFLQLSPEVRKEHDLLNSVLRIHDSAPESEFEEQMAQTLKNNLNEPWSSSKSLVFMTEQAYSADSSYVELSANKDSFGLNKTKITWNLTEKDWDSYLRSINLFKKEIEKQNIGYVKINKTFLDRKAIPSAGPHHMGTTKMASKRSKGVVNENLASFSVPNLYVLGSSVFPRGGCANPTFTIVALAIRLAKHIEKTLS